MPVTVAPRAVLRLLELAQGRIKRPFLSTEDWPPAFFPARSQLATPACWHQSEQATVWRGRIDEVARGLVIDDRRKNAGVHCAACRLRRSCWPDGLPGDLVL